MKIHHSIFNLKVITIYILLSLKNMKVYAITLKVINNCKAREHNFNN